MQLAERSWAAARLNQRAKRFLQPAVVAIKGSQHQVFFAFEMLVESCLADADIRQNLIDSHVAKPVAVKTANGCLDEPLSSGRLHDFAGKRDRFTASQPRVYQESTVRGVRTHDNTRRLSN